MAELPRIYLDNAATSWPKPEAVYQAVDDYLRRQGAPAGRSAYAEGLQISQTVDTVRRDVAALIGADSPEHIIFTLNGTDALNLAIHGVLREGDHVVTSVVEHNSVLRPLRDCEEQGIASITRVACGAAGFVDPQAIRAALTPRTRLIALTHASNVTGALQPIEQVGWIAREHGALLLVDAAQTLGHVPIRVANLNADLLAAPGHKGLLGPLGTGILWIRPGIENQLRSIRQGGTGTRSEEDRQPDALPAKYESGSLNLPGIAGLGAAVRYLAERGVADVRQHDMQLTERLLAGLREIAAVRIHGPQSAAERVGLVSITLEGYDPQEVAAMLDAAYRVQVRAGLHCAPLAHRALGTVDQGGTVRLSIGALNTVAEIDAALSAVQEIASATLSF